MDNADRGGNSVLVRGGNLHGLWDVTVVRLAISKKLFDQPPKMGWQSGSIATWMQESHALAETVVYGKLPAGWTCNAVPEGRIELGSDYLEAAAPVASQQLQKAGARLARVLNDSLR